MKTTTIVLALAAIGTATVPLVAQETQQEQQRARQAQAQAQAQAEAQARQSRAGGQPDLDDVLYPPELVMRYQTELGITADQRSVITEAIRSLQSSALDIEWEMRDQNQILTDMLTAEPMDAAAILAQARTVLDLENRVKLAHIGAAIAIRSALTPEQRNFLDHRRQEQRGASWSVRER